MFLFNLSSSKLYPISEQQFALEKEMQKLTEDNLEQVFGLQFVSTEFSLQNFRIDTLAYDMENQSFVIIEYKKGSSWSVIDQGYSYLSLMLNNKAEFAQALSIKKNKVITNKDINWENSKVVFVANGFNQYQKESINFKDLPIELRELKKYDNLIIYNPIKSRNSLASVKTIEKQDKEIAKVNAEIKTYTVDDHFIGVKQAQRPLYEALKERLLQLDPRFEESVQKSQLSLKLNGKRVLTVAPSKDKLTICFMRTKPTDFVDPDHKLIYMEKSKEYYNQDLSRMYAAKEKDLEYVLYILQQVLNKNLY